MMNFSYSRTYLFMALSFTLFLTGCSSLFQESLPQSLTCGGTHQGSFSENFEKQDFEIELIAGQSVTVALTPVGDYLLTALELYEPASDRIIFQQDPVKAPGFESEVLSATGTYLIRVRNYGLFPDDRIDYQTKGRAGDYRLEVGCN
ncbi:MAG: hypothetical protein KC422_09725 [Trueperaceae bacterium]|nr:hypothetical protein [Trueperaceae bacterium]